ncbi:hypothetical protein ACFQZC_14895 [Streptacidiphilus monticola]
MPALLPTALVSRPEFSPELAELTETELIAALHASEYRPTMDPAPADLATFALQGLRFRGGSASRRTRSSSSPTGWCSRRTTTRPRWPRPMPRTGRASTRS